MAIVARTIGGPGAGKTTRALQIMEMVLEKLVRDPHRIGFVSFTRAARAEAASRAADKFNVPIQSLEKTGWFRTLHSVAYRCLGVVPGELLTGTEEDNNWLKDVFGDDGARVAGSEDDDLFAAPSDASASCRALSMWDCARNRLSTLESVWAKQRAVDDRVPDLVTCEAVATVYEAAKREGGRLDFCDLMMRYAGRAWTGDHSRPFADCEPVGHDPNLPVWIHDEAQDASPLTWAVFQRLSRFASWVYLMGDTWQSVYEWAGADGDLFGACQVAKEETLPTSHRCPERILHRADQVMLCGGAAPRPFAASRAGGDVEERCLESALQSVRADQTTLVLARTNEYARHAAAILDQAGVPWVPTKGNGGYNAPARAAGVCALARLRRGEGINGEAVHRVMDLLPAVADGTRLLERGAKSHYADKATRAEAHRLQPLTLEYCADAGFTRQFRELVASGRYLDLLEKPAQRMARAAEVHGVDAVLHPKVRVGTCHSAKGAQAEHVVAVNKLPRPTAEAIQDEAEMQAERRVWYVTLSRASEKLTIADDGGEQFPDL